MDLEESIEYKMDRCGKKWYNVGKMGGKKIVKMY